MIERDNKMTKNDLISIVVDYYKATIQWQEAMQDKRIFLGKSEEVIDFSIELNNTQLIAEKIKKDKSDINSMGLTLDEKETLLKACFLMQADLEKTIQPEKVTLKLNDLKDVIQEITNDNTINNKIGTLRDKFLSSYSTHSYGIKKG
jgi:hypothetical protein